MTEYDYQYGKYKPSIELDEEEAEYARCTCLDRARIALEQTGQVTCAIAMKNLQCTVKSVADEIGREDIHSPVLVIEDLLAKYTEACNEAKK